MDDFRKRVSDVIAEGIEVEYIDAFEEEEAVEVNEPYTVWSPNGGYVNLREAPDTTSKSMVRLYPGDTVMVKTMTSVWSEVEFEAVGGYVMTQFLKKDEPQIQPDTISIPRNIAQKMYNELFNALNK